MAITLTVENGNGLADANCYCDLSFLDAHAELNGETLTQTDEQKKAAIYISANKFIDRLHDFKGAKVSSTQAMKIYTDLVSYAGSSKDIMQANAEAAILHLKGFLFVDASAQNANGEILSLKTKLDTLEKETTFSDGSRIRTKYDTSTIDALLKPYLAVSSGGVMLRVV
jgi:hypothetical protein